MPINDTGRATRGDRDDRLVQSAKLNGHDPYAYLRDVPERMPTHPASRIDDLLPHSWKMADPHNFSEP